MSATKIGYARCSTDGQDLTAQKQALETLGVAPDRVYTDHGLTGTNRARPGLDQAIAAVRDTFRRTLTTERIGKFRMIGLPSTAPKAKQLGNAVLTERRPRELSFNGFHWHVHPVWEMVRIERHEANAFIEEPALCMGVIFQHIQDDCGTWYPECVASAVR